MASLVVNDADGVAQRVRRLTQLATLDKFTSSGRTFEVWTWTCFATILALAILLSTNPSTLLAVHNLIEIVVSNLR
jgi:hypothetical protein